MLQDTGYMTGGRSCGVDASSRDLDQFEFMDGFCG